MKKSYLTRVLTLMSLGLLFQTNVATAQQNYCTYPVNGESFNWNYSGSTIKPNGSYVTQLIADQPATNGGYTFDIYNLDNSFNMKINGVNIADKELQFQITPATLVPNVRFASDQARWEITAGLIGIWTYAGSQAEDKPLIRVVITSDGDVELYASRVSANDANYALEPLELFNNTTFGNITWNTNTTNTVEISQLVTGATLINGRGYGIVRKDCLRPKNDINQTPQNIPVDGNVLTNDEGDGLEVKEIIIGSTTFTIPTDGSYSTEITVSGVDQNDNPIPNAGAIKIDMYGNYVYTPAIGFVGQLHPIVYTAEHGSTQQADGSLVVHVIPNHLNGQEYFPVAQNDYNFIKKDSELKGNILVNDSDPKGLDLTVVEAMQGTTSIALNTTIQVDGVNRDNTPIANAGTISIYANGNHTFQPATGFTGTIDPIKYKIENTDNKEEYAYLHITVFPKDEDLNTTYANDDAQTASKGENIGGNVLDNDFDPENDIQTVASITVGGNDYPLSGTPETVVIPGKGTIVINQNGDYTWTPVPEFAGTVVVGYTACDSGTPEACNDATLYLTNVDDLANISGTIQHDENGVTDNTIDGDGLGVLDNEPLYITLVDGNDEVVAVVPVNTDGTYEFSEIPTGDYTLVLTTEQPNIGDPTPSTNLPNDWVNVGESTTTTGHDGTPDGKLAITLPKEGIVNVNFGIEEKPTADPKVYDDVVNSMFSQTVFGDFPAVNDYRGIPANSSALTGSHGGSFSGTDPEDCANASSCNTNTGTTFAIETMNANTKLYYDFGNGPIEIDLNNDAVSIENFDVDKLAIYGENGSGDENNPLGFTYTMVDAAGVKSDAEFYTISTIHPLPIQLVSFDAAKKGQIAVLDWITAAEENNSGFDIERSVDGKNWNEIGFTATQAENGNSSATLNYQFVDEQPMSGANFYRLKQVDLDGAFDYSKIRQLVFDNFKNALQIYPNPAQDYVVVEGLNSKATIHIINAVGQEVLKQTTESNTMKLNINTLPSGMYYIHIIQDGVEVQVEKVMITK